MRIALYTLGCKLNYAETSTYERGFIAAGAEIVDINAEDIDAYLINTCSVTQHSDNKCRNIIRKCHRLSPGASIVVTGCYAELKRDEIAAIEGVRLIFGAKEKSKVVSQTLELIGLHSEAGKDEGDVFGAYSSGERTRSFLKVQDGCNNFCAYCTVPYARGLSRNIPICSIVRQAKDIAATGIKEIVLTGVNTGDFGRTTGESFLDLLKALNEVEGIERYRISSIEPNLITEEIIDWIAGGTKFQPHFHIPLQTADDELLAKMGRRYDTDFFASKIEYIRHKMEGEGKLPVFFGIDVIVGLPGETEEKFESTFKYLEERVKPAFIHIFPYSIRPGTRAALMKDQVQDSIKTERVKRLEALSDRLYSDFVNSCKGLKAKVLWESSERNGTMSGYTDNYMKIDTDFDDSKSGLIEEITI